MTLTPYTEPPNWGYETPFYDTPSQNGVIAFEFEMEGVGLAPGLVEGSRTWSGTRDGSLRGESSAEFISRGPHSLDRWGSALNLLRTALEGAEITPSTRCSTHVHLNMQTFTIPQIGNFAFLWYLVEDFMVDYCDPHRRGNVFALRLQDAESLFEPLIEFLQTGSPPRRTPQYRYSALNYNALFKFGSMEIRSHQGVSDPRTIRPWAEMLLELWHAAQRFRDPLEIVEQFSALSAAGFVSAELPLIWERTVSQQGGTEHRLFESVRRIQEIAYNIQWRMAPRFHARGEQPTRARSTPRPNRSVSFTPATWEAVGRTPDDISSFNARPRQ